MAMSAISADLKKLIETTRSNARSEFALELVEHFRLVADKVDNHASIAILSICQEIISRSRKWQT